MWQQWWFFCILLPPALLCLNTLCSVLGESSADSEPKKTYRSFYFSHWNCCSYTFMFYSGIKMCWQSSSLFCSFWQWPGKTDLQFGLSCFLSEQTLLCLSLLELNVQNFSLSREIFQPSIHIVYHFCLFCL